MDTVMLKAIFLSDQFASLDEESEVACVGGGGDPEGVTLRWSYTVQRRKYSVYGPNALWHIDGQHGLIRWRLVIHGGFY